MPARSAGSGVLSVKPKDPQRVSAITQYFLRYQRRANHRPGIRLLERFVDLCQGEGVRDELVKRIALEVAPHEIQRLRDDPWLVGGQRYQRDAAEDDASGLERGRLLGIDAAHDQVAAAVL